MAMGQCYNYRTNSESSLIDVSYSYIESMRIWYPMEWRSTRIVVQTMAANMV